MSTDVLIVGAGATGLTLAIELARRHVPFRLIEKLPHPFAGSRGKAIGPRTLEVMEDLGLIDRLTAVGSSFPLQRTYMTDGSYHDSLVMQPLPANPTEPYLVPLLVPQFATESIMRDRLSELGSAVEFGVELRRFAQDADYVTAIVSGGSGAEGEETIRCRYLVGADGGRSFVRHALEIAFEGKTLGARAVVADVTLDGLSRDVWHRFNDGSRTQSLAICPLPHTDLFQMQAPVPLEADVDLSAEALTAMIAARAERTDITVRSVSWSSVYSMNARLASRWTVGRVFLAGDSAHIHPPHGGQGLNTSVQDAYNLGWKLAAVLSGAPASLLATYEEERQPIAASMLGMTSRLLEGMKAGKMARTREVTQLDLTYAAHSSLVLKASRTSQSVEGALRAGDRAPDALLTGAAGQARRLFSLLTGTHWTLLGYDTDGSATVRSRAGLRVHRVGVGCELQDDRQQLRDGYGLVSGEWVLIRPDGYVAAIVRSEDVGMLENYLETVGVR